jgi:glycosyltransferase involved in cell wall biosynthesis
MRVVQLVDSLDAGGAERMAVNLANHLSNKVDFSGIIVTRTEGRLSQQLQSNVPYFFLNKRNTLDLKALFDFKKIIKKNNIDIVHVHGTSFFFAFLLKIIFFRTKLLYHEHYGNRLNQGILKNVYLIFCLLFFDKILVVNNQLKDWFQKMGFKKVFFVSNFASFDENVIPQTQLSGIEGKRIVCLSNLKKPKNHLFLLKAFQLSNVIEQGWTLHLVGKNYHDNYAENLFNFIKEYNLQQEIKVYDVQSDIKNILSQANIGVLCSTHEGFPVTLLEYGMAKLAVISSNVGFCSEIIRDRETGLLFDPDSINEFVSNLKTLVSDSNLRNKISLQLENVVEHHYSKDLVVHKIIQLYSNENIVVTH